MCGGPEHSKPVAKNYRMMVADDVLGRSALSHPEGLLKPPLLWSDMDKGCKDRETAPSLLELAANNDLEAFRRAVEENGMDLDEPDSWYLRKIGSTKMATEKRSPLMIAALYGSIDVLSYILNSGKVDVNKFCGEDEVTALHCAAAGGSSRGVDAVTLLLTGGANKNLTDVYGRRPAQVIAVPLKLRSARSELEKMLSPTGTARHSLDTDCKKAHQSNGGGAFSSSKLDDDNFAETREGFVSMSSMSSVCSSPDSYSPVFSPQYPSSPKSAENPSDEKKDYPVDPSLPDIKNSIYTTDEFRMFSFKVRPCSRAYSHDWTECPFVHPGENARRRDPRRFHYSCVPCPDFRKGACRRGDTCEYAHGVFECWLHPAQYRTRLCKDGTSCSRRVCFFAHTSEEMRPLFVSMGSAVPSPRASSPLDAGSVSPPLPSTSQTPVIMVPPFSPSNASGSGLSTPPLSPSAGGSWSQPTVPTLHLPGGAGLQASRLRAALSARDIPVDELSSRSGNDYDGHLASELSSISRQSSLLSSSARMHKFGNLGLSIPSTNLQDLFSAEVSPMSAVHQSQLTPQEHSILSQQLHSQLQLQQLLSPLSTMSQLQSHVSPQFQSPVQSIFSPCSMARRSSDGTELSTSTAAEALAARKASAFAQRDRGSWSMKEVSGSLPSASWSDWGSPTGKPDWGIQGQDLGKFRKSASFATHGGPEPDLSWVQTLVKDGPLESSSSSSTDDVYGNWASTEQQQQQ